MSNDFASAWDEFISVLDTVIEGHSKSLNPGNERESIHKIESCMSIRFPEDLVEFYRLCDGESDELLCGSALGLHFNSLDQLYQEWSSWKQVLEDFNKEDLESINSSAT